MLPDAKTMVILIEWLSYSDSVPWYLLPWHVTILHLIKKHGIAIVHIQKPWYYRGTVSVECPKLISWYFFGSETSPFTCSAFLESKEKDVVRKNFLTEACVCGWDRERVIQWHPLKAILKLCVCGWSISLLNMIYIMHNGECTVAFGMVFYKIVFQKHPFVCRKWTCVWHDHGCVYLFVYMGLCMCMWEWKGCYIGRIRVI